MGYDQIVESSFVRARSAERRFACLASCVCFLVIASLALYWANEDLVARNVDSLVDNTFGALSTFGSVAVLGLAVCATAIIPSPLHPLTLIAAGYILGFGLGLTMLPFGIVGDCIFFLLLRCACKQTSAAVVAGRKNLRALKSALQTGGLKLLVLAKFVPPPTLSDVAMVALDVPFYQFTIATVVHCCTHLPILIFFGSSAQSLASAISSSATAGSESESDGVDSANLATTVAGLVASVLVCILMVCLTRRELRKSGMTNYRVGDDEEQVPVTGSE